MSDGNWVGVIWWSLGVAACGVGCGVAVDAARFRRHLGRAVRGSYDLARGRIFFVAVSFETFERFQRRLLLAMCGLGLVLLAMAAIAAAVRTMGR